MCPPETPGAVLSGSSIARHKAQLRKRRSYFLKGPIPFGWIVDNMPDPTCRLILVARAFMDMSKTDECVLEAKVWQCAGIADRYQKRRVLQNIRTKVPDYRIVSRDGRPSILKCLRPDRQNEKEAA